MVITTYLNALFEARLLITQKTNQSLALQAKKTSIKPLYYGHLRHFC